MRVSCFIACLTLALTARQDVPPTQWPPYDPAIIGPKTILGYDLGERHTTYLEQQRVLDSLVSQRADRMKLIQYGTTAEGRALRVVVCSSAENMNRLDEIKTNLDRLAQGNLGKEDRANLIRRTPSVVWINECIHGNETASFESGMWLLYNLAASQNPKLQEALKNTVVVVNPSYNPDGHERYVVYYNSIAIASPERDAFERIEPSVIHGRTNHYRFDMNRDRVALSQAETRAEVAEVRRWNPQVYLDQHGQTSEYFFPPNPMSINANTDRDRINHWTQIFGKSYASAFDQNGWLYFTRYEYDLYYAGYLDTFNALLGAVAMTHETDGGKTLNGKKDDGSPVTLRIGAEKHLTTALATIMTASTRHDELMISYSDYKQRAASGEHAGKFQRVVVTSADPRPLHRLHEHLARAGIRSGFAKEAFSQGKAHDFWSPLVWNQKFAAGSLVIDMAQPNGPLAKSLLEPGQDFEPAFIKKQLEIGAALLAEKQYPPVDQPEFYDLTGWSLIYGYGVKAWWCESAPKIALSESANISGEFHRDDQAIGYALDYLDVSDILAAADLAFQGLTLHVSNDPMKLGGQEFPRGSLLVLKGRNPKGYEDKLEAVSRTRNVRFRSVPTAFPDEGRFSPGSQSTDAIAKPKIGVVFGSERDTTDYGALWYLFEKVWYEPFTPLATRALQGDLTKYSAIIFPAGDYAAPSPKLKDWVRAGGCAVVMGNPYWALGSEGFADLKAKEMSGKGKPAEPLNVPGSLYKAELSGDSFLSHGYGIGKNDVMPFTVPVDGSMFFGSKPEGGGVVSFPSDEKRVSLLSGWQWQDNTDKALAGSVIVHDQPYGAGRVVFFLADISDRAMWPLYDKMLWNAILLGPRAKP